MQQAWDSKGRLYYVDELGNRVEPQTSLNPFQKFGRKLQTGFGNLERWLNETNPESQAYKDKVNAVLALEAAYLGKRIMQNKLYEFLVSPKANPNFKQDLSLFKSPPPSIDPNKIKVEIGGVSERINNLGLENGYNLSGFSHILDNSGYNHFRNGHLLNEVDPRLLPLNKNDIYNLPNVIYKPDAVEFLNATKRKLPRIKYTKKTKNGTQIYVEQIQNKTKRLNTKTMWKEKN